MTSEQEDSPMAGRREFDVTVVGASGFTGCRVVKKLFDMSKEQALGWKIAVAARNKERLRDTLAGAGVAWRDTTFIQVDAMQPETLVAMAKRTRMTINCSGPFRLFGEPVVAACVAQGSHYIDICGEPEFIERMAIKYHDAAQEAGVIVVSACGFDSIPADMGTLFAVEEFAKQGGVASSVESFLEVQCPVKYTANATTWDCAVMGFANANKLTQLRRSQPRIRVPTRGKRLPRSKLPRRVRALASGFALPFMGSDASIVRRSMQRFHTDSAPRPADAGSSNRVVAALSNGALPVEFAAYFLVQSRLSLLLFFVAGFLFFVMSRCRVGQNCLMDYPSFFSCGVFSRRGPTEEAMRSATFSMTFVTRGFFRATVGKAKPTSEPDCVLTTRVTGPDPGYIGTAKLVACAANVVLQQLAVVPKNVRRSGVLTTAVAFQGTRLLPLLSKEGVEFQVVKPLTNTHASSTPATK